MHDIYHTHTRPHKQKHMLEEKARITKQKLEDLEATTESVMWDLELDAFLDAFSKDLEEEANSLANEKKKTPQASLGLSKVAIRAKRDRQVRRIDDDSEEDDDDDDADWSENQKRQKK